MPKVVPVSNLREFFHESVQHALREQRVDIDDHTEHYVVNVLTMFARSEELYDRTQEGIRLKPLAHMLAQAAEAPRKLACHSNQSYPASNVSILLGEQRRRSSSSIQRRRQAALWKRE